MFGLGPTELMIVVVVLLLALVGPVAWVRTRHATLVLRSFEVYCTPQASGQPLVEIVGRPAGVIAFVLTVLQLQPQTKLIATDSGIEYEMASLFGQIKKFIPMSRVASMSAGLHKPVGYLIVAGLLFLIGAMISVQIGSSIPIVVALVFAGPFWSGILYPRACFLKSSLTQGLRFRCVSVQELSRGCLLIQARHLRRQELFVI